MELNDINAEIRRLKELRFKLYGKEWRKLVHERQRREKIPQESINKYIRYFEEQMALRSLNVGQLSKELDIHRYSYSYLKRGVCSVATSTKIECAMSNYGTCLECEKNRATHDYNGHQYYVCQLCFDSLNREFDRGDW